MSDDLLYHHAAPVEIEPIESLGDELPSSRVPHLGHAILFVSFAGLLLLLTQLIFLSISNAHDVPGSVKAAIHPKQQLATMGITYVVTLAFSFLAFPLFWQRSFLSGIAWHGRKALTLSIRLISLGLSLGWMVQAISSLIPVPKSMPMDNFFRNPSDVWLVAGFGTLIAPLFEEITFRGFLLPAATIAFDWLRGLARFAIALARGERPSRAIVFFGERASAGLSEAAGNLSFRGRVAIVLASLVTSALFALLHADQLAHASGALYILFCVSLVLTVVRVQTHSVACSTLVHASYNLSVFVTLFIGTGGFRHLDKLAH